MGTGLLRMGERGTAMNVNAISSVQMDCWRDKLLNLRVRGPKKSMGSCFVDGTLIIVLLVVEVRLREDAVIQLDARRFMLLRLFPKFMECV